MMAEAPEAKTVVEEFLRRQREMYAGGDLAAVEELLAEDVVWHVPGTSPIAGNYCGREAVTGYFGIRRDLAGGAIRVTKGGEAHHEEALVQLADGRAELGGREVVWRTAGVYRVADGRSRRRGWYRSIRSTSIGSGARLVRRPSFTCSACAPRSARRARCSATHVCWSSSRPRSSNAGATASVHRMGASGSDRSLTVAAVNVRYLAPVRSDDELRIEVALDRLAQHSIQVHYDAFVGDTRIAEARLALCLPRQAVRRARLAARRNRQRLRRPQMRSLVLRGHPPPGLARRRPSHSASTSAKRSCARWRWRRATSTSP